MGFPRVDHAAGENELQGSPLTDQPRQTLRAAAAWDQPEGDFGLTEFGVLCGHPDGARHRGLAAAAKRIAVHGGDHRLAEVFDQIQDRLPVTARLLGLDRGDVRELADVGAGDKGLVACPGQDHAADFGVVARVLEYRAQLLPSLPIEGVEHPGAVQRHIGNGALFVVQQVFQYR